jgi:hypothetical protein
MPPDRAIPPIFRRYLHRHSPPARSAPPGALLRDTPFRPAEVVAGSGHFPCGDPPANQLHSGSGSVGQTHHGRSAARYGLEGRSHWPSHLLVTRESLGAAWQVPGFSFCFRRSAAGTNECLPRCWNSRPPTAPPLVPVLGRLPRAQSSMAASLSFSGSFSGSALVCQPSLTSEEWRSSSMFRSTSACRFSKCSATSRRLRGFGAGV